MVFDARFRGVLVGRVTVAVRDPGTLDGREQIVVVTRVVEIDLIRYSPDGSESSESWVAR